MTIQPSPRARAATMVAAAALAITLAACGSNARTVPSHSSSSYASPGPSARPLTTASAAPAPGAPVTAGPQVTGAPPLTAAPDPCGVSRQAALPSAISASFATAIAFAPDGRLFYAERSGTVRVWQNGASRAFASVATVTTEAGGGYSERGLLGLAVSPTFAADHFVYGFYSDRDRRDQHVIRWRDCAGAGMDATLIVTLPSGHDCCHKGGRIAFGGDRMLYVTLGEEHAADAAQNPADVRGKVLRYTPSGTVPTDNPFGPTNPVWAYGLRNPFGIAFAASGQMAITSNGPSGDAGSPSTGFDTLVLAVGRGAGYQWPACYGYSHPLAAPAGCSARTAPDWSSEQRTVIPTGAAFVDASGPAPFAGHLVFCTYAAGMLIVSPGSPHATVAAGPAECRLAVAQGPDHAVYFSDEWHIYRRG